VIIQAMPLNFVVRGLLDRIELEPAMQTLTHDFFKGQLMNFDRPTRDFDLLDTPCQLHYDSLVQ
jgi:hypothetical protein